MTDNDKQPKDKNKLICFRKKYRKIARSTLLINLILLFTYLILSFVYQSVNFNSVAYYVLVAVTIVVTIADFVMLIISYCIDRLIDVVLDDLIAEQEDISDSNNCI